MSLLIARRRSRGSIDAVLAGDANNERAKSLQAKANVHHAARNRGPAKSGSSDKPAIAVAPAQGGLEVLQGETEKACRHTSPR
jgi:hypothetical protein